MTKSPYRSKDGYIKIYRPEHPASNTNGYVSEHVVVMEQYIGCTIPPGCHVHHRDLNRGNNEISNLLLMRSASDHMMLHSAIDAGNQELVAAYERWSAELMTKLKDGLTFAEACTSRSDQPKLFDKKNFKQPNIIVRKRKA